MSIEQDRLVSLIKYASETTTLTGRVPPYSVSQHEDVFALYEHQINGLQGIETNVGGGNEDSDEVWLIVKRLAETKPRPPSPILKPWLHLHRGPDREPELWGEIPGSNLIDAGTHRSSRRRSFFEDEADLPEVDPQQSVTFDSYEKASQVSRLFTIYLRDWNIWADGEKLRRKTVQLYSRLFTLKQALDGGLIESQLELCWGIGMGVWQVGETTVSYPLITRLVEISLNEENASIEIRPRDVAPRMELDWYAAQNISGVTDLEKAAKDQFKQAQATFSPFDPVTYEPILRSAQANLDSTGVYLPDQERDSTVRRSLPTADVNLKITDTWVLFARPRSRSEFVRDLERLKKNVEEISPETYPAALLAIVSAPVDDNTALELPAFRGVSMSNYEPESGTKARDLYFPKAFNDEQVRIIQMLEVSPGVVVQGPPGTGKTHTIANIICHYLANGKRVLVTSMKDPALAVLRDQLPDEIRPLAISLLSSEQDGMRQFEHAIQKIAAGVQAMDRPARKREIDALESSIDGLHGKLALLDRRFGDFAKQNLATIHLGDESIQPEQAAREVVAGTGEFEWIKDPLGAADKFEPRFSDQDVISLREARRVLGQDIHYLDSSLPQSSDFPELTAILAVHRDLSQFQLLQQKVQVGEIPTLKDSTQQTIERANLLLAQVENIVKLRDEILQYGRAWTVAIRDRMHRSTEDHLINLFERLGQEIANTVESRTIFITRPVIPGNADSESEVIIAVSNLAVGRRPFGLKGIFGKADSKRLIESIRIGSTKPVDRDSWAHVNAYFVHRQQLRELAVRWNALAPELHIDRLSNTEPEDCLIAHEHFSLYLKIKTLVGLEQASARLTPDVFPNWVHSNELLSKPFRLNDLHKAILHHLAQFGLAYVWQNKGKSFDVLEGHSGRVVDDIRNFLDQTWGNPSVSDLELQSHWSSLMAELGRVRGASTLLKVVRDVCASIGASGAPNYSLALKQPIDGIVDALLPGNWRKCWRLRRLATHLEEIDTGNELKRLGKVRQQTSLDLAHKYKRVVELRTWLKLAENATPIIQAALQAYLNAIRKIGKGTGVRAVGYREDARSAAVLANPAVPCWIMSHFRVSESLPSKIGCFDLVIIDEASQSDLSALPALLRAKRILVVGDDKQVSPEGVGIQVAQANALMARHLGDHVPIYRQQLSPERSIYDFYQVVFARSMVMLKEHFRCVEPIIEYSKREFYNHELRPLRIPKSSERLDPPLLDILVEDGHRKGDINIPEAQFIVEEIKKIALDPQMTNRSIGVVSLLADKQALKVWNLLSAELGVEVMQRHNIACGDARTFQGKERDIIFLSMVAAPNDMGAPLARATFEQRFNVAASRAKNRMYLVRSLEIDQLPVADRLRRSLIAHFAQPFSQNQDRAQNLRELCDSDFEREVFDELVQRGFRVTPQVKVGKYRIDMVVEGHNDARLAIECDGDQFHGADRWDADMARQRLLERAGWSFWRCFASAFVRRRRECVDDLLQSLRERGIDPIGAEGAPKSIHVGHRRWSWCNAQEAQNAAPNPETTNAVE